MAVRLTPIAASSWRITVALLTVWIVTVSVLRYLTGTLMGSTFITGNAFANPFLVIHVVGGTTALALGPLQLVATVRTRFPRAHRLAGRGYVLACLVAAPAGFMLALGTNAGPVAGAGFAVLAVLWATFTTLGWRAALERRIAEHRAWMLRSYAATSTAITLRLILPLSGVLGLDQLTSYRAIAWLSWMINLVLVEAWLRRPGAAPARGFALA